MSQGLQHFNYILLTKTICNQTVQDLRKNNYLFNIGLEPTTLWWRVSWFPNWASQASKCYLKVNLCKTPIQSLFTLSLLMHTVDWENLCVCIKTSHVASKSCSFYILSDHNFEAYSIRVVRIPWFERQNHKPNFIGTS